MGWLNFTFEVKSNLKCQHSLFHHYRKCITTTAEGISAFNVALVVNDFAIQILFPHVLFQHPPVESRGYYDNVKINTTKNISLNTQKTHGDNPANKNFSIVKENMSVTHTHTQWSFCPKKFFRGLLWISICMLAYLILSVTQITIRSRWYIYRYICKYNVYVLYFGILLIFYRFPQMPDAQSY